MGFVFLFQRATLAEKEVSSLKEQLSSSNPGSQAPSESKEPGPGGMEQRTNLETELQAKDKEVSIFFKIIYKKRGEKYQKTFVRLKTSSKSDNNQ